jgi:hypothetical protein
MSGLASISIRFKAIANLLLDRANQPRLKDRLRCALGRKGPETRFPNGGFHYFCGSFHSALYLILFNENSRCKYGVLQQLLEVADCETRRNSPPVTLNFWRLHFPDCAVDTDEWKEPIRITLLRFRGITSSAQSANLVPSGPLSSRA